MLVSKIPFSLLVLLSLSFQIKLNIAILLEKQPFYLNLSQSAGKILEKYLCGGKFSWIIQKMIFPMRFTNTFIKQFCKYLPYFSCYNFSSCLGTHWKRLTSKFVWNKPWINIVCPWIHWLIIYFVNKMLFN